MLTVGLRQVALTVIFVAWGFIATLSPMTPPVSATWLADDESPEAIFGSGPWTNFSVTDGLASDSILAVASTSSGHLWVGTNVGLSILSPGGDWLTLTSGDGLSDNIVTDIALDPASPRYHWFATNGGGSLLDDGDNPLDKSVHNWITFGTSDGLVDQSLSAVAVDAGGRIWFGTDRLDSSGNESGFGVSVLNTNGTPFLKADDAWVTYSATTSSLSNNVIRDIAVDGQGVVWIATQSGLNAYSANTWTAFYTSDGLPSNDIRALLVSNNVIWMATNAGVAVLSHANTPHNKADDQWATYTQSNSGLVNNSTKALSMDGAGRLWIGTNWLVSGGDSGAGVSVLDPAGTPFNRADDTWTTFTTSDRLASNAVRALFSAGTGIIWLGTNNGLSRLNYGSSPFIKSDDQWISHTARNRISGYSAYAAADAGTTGIWLGTEQGLSFLNYNASPHFKQDDAWTTYTAADDRLPADRIRALAMDSRGRLWIGTSAGLMVRDTRGSPANKTDDLHITYTSSSGLAHDQVNDIVIDGAGRAWIACGSYFAGALHVLSIGNSLTSRSDDTWATFTPANSGLPDTYVTAVALDGSNIAWVGTQAGAARLNYGSSPFVTSDDVWTVFTAGNSGLAYNSVRDVAVDYARNVWFGLAIEGVSAYSPGGAWVTFKQTDGLANNSVQAVLVDWGGNVWLGTDGGGVSVLNYKGTLTEKGDDSWSTYTGGGTLQSGNINTLTLDRWGQVWIGTFGGGASLYSTVEFKRVFLPLIRR